MLIFNTFIYWFSFGIYNSSKPDAPLFYPTIYPNPLLQVQLLSLSKSFTKLVHHRRNGYQRNRNEPQQRVPPPDAQGFVHLGPGQGQEGGDGAAHDGKGGEGAGGVHGVGVDDVGLDGEPDADDADAEGDEADDGDDPVDGLVGAPAVPEEGDGEEEGEVDAVGEAHLGLVDAVVGLGHAHDGLVGEDGEGAEAACVADEQGEVDDAGDADGPAVAALEDHGDGVEEEVETAVGEGDVEGDAEEDGGEEEELHGADEAVEKDTALRLGGCIWVDVAASKFWSVEFLSESVRFALDEDLVVGLALEEDHGDENERRGDEGDPVDPAPANGLCYETTDDRGTRRTKHGAKHPKSHGSATFTHGEEVGDDGAADGLRSRPSDAAHETEEDEGIERGSKSASDKPDAEPCVCYCQDNSSSIDFG